MEAFNILAESNYWGNLLPEITLGCTALVLLVLDLLWPDRAKWLIPMVAMGVQAFMLIVLFFANDITSGISFSGLIFQNTLTEIMRIFFLIASLFVSYLAVIYLKRHKLPRLEFFLILLVATVSLMLLVQSHHFLMLFIALETLTVSLFILICYNNRSSSFSLEAGLKYLILGAVSSSILLFGIVLLYGIAGNPTLPSFTTDALNFFELGKFITANSDNVLVQIAVAMVMCGIAFKVGAVPFQIWIPDVYQGAPTPVTAFLAVSSKAAGFIVLINLVKGPFASLGHLLIPLLSTIATMSILFGNITALSQYNVKRLMGLSGISHAGYLLVGVVASFYVELAVPAIVFYLFTYLLGSFAVFCVMAHLSGEEDAEQELDSYDKLAKNSPFLAGVLTMGIGSLAGIPPLVGFIGKVLIFIAAYQAKLYVLLAVSIVGVVISIYYYFGWIRESYFLNLSLDEADTKEAKGILSLTWIHRLVLGLLGSLTLLLGVYQGLITKYFF